MIVVKPKKKPKITFQVRLTMFFFFISLLVEIGIITVVSRQIQKANSKENYQYLLQESVISATTIGDILYSNLEFLQLVSINSEIREQLIESNRQYPQQPEVIERRLTTLEKEWSNSEQSSLVKNTLTNKASLELIKNNRVFVHLDKVYVTDKYGALVSSTEYIDRFSFRQQPWWKYTFNQGKGNIYIGEIKFDNSQQKSIISLALPVYANDRASEIIGIIYAEHNFDAEIDNIFKQLKTKKNLPINQSHDLENEIHIHRIYIDNNHYFDYENKKIVREASLTLEKINQELTKPVNKFNYEGKPTYLTKTQITSIESAGIFSQTIDNLQWYLVTITSHEQNNLFSISSQIVMLLIIALLLLLLSICFTLYILNVITNPVKQMIKIAEDINNDNFSPEDLQNLSQVARQDNYIGQLATVFRDMALVVTSRTKNLTQQIEQMKLKGNHSLSSYELGETDNLANNQNQLKDKVKLNILRNSQALRNKLNQNISASTLETRSSTITTTALDASFIELCQQKLAQYIGLIAKDIVDEVIARHPRITPSEFVDSLAREIPDSNQALEFKTSLSGLSQE